MGVAIVAFEILIAGLQAFIGFSLVLFALFGKSSFDVNMLKGWEALGTILILALSYSLGILVDRVSDTLFSPLDHKLRRKVLPEKDAPVREMRLYLISIDDGTSRMLEYMRSRLRTARATAVNFVLIFVGFMVYRIAHQFAVLDTVTLFALLIMVAAVAASFFAWQRITKAYYLRLAQAYHIVVSHSIDNAIEENEHATQ